MEDTPETIDTESEAALAAAAEALRTKIAKSPLTPEMKADPISRKLISLSLFFASLAVICIGFLTFIHFQKKHALHANDPKTVIFKPEPVITQKIEQIQVKLKNEQDLRVEISTECSQKETCNFIKDNPERVRDVLIPILTNIDPYKLSSVESKNLLRQKIVDRINTLEAPGKVSQVNFINLSVEGKPHHEPQ